VELTQRANASRVSFKKELQLCPKLNYEGKRQRPRKIYDLVGGTYLIGECE